MRLREPSARVVQRARVKQAVAEVFKVFKERYGALDCLAVLMDLFSRKVVGWSLDKTMTNKLAAI